ncbi:SDR family oxidoreductase [Emticicia sp. BO119]|uniref:SDR family oxidoreductase n=1 Tax=Emticicia sp. BO119 TaxID=2757768 RepID=UPI0015F0100F|nr:SDR family NAD(P)-dependent oxidoreductase [Emticicia sp. BO119]MBA4852628.1 SDR family NAD(P)-dependent oxidoreductase [Emticicia sp. BO119]
MKTTQNTILVTGGSAGIGFEIAQLFSKQGNHVIIVGRDEERLTKAAAKLQNVTPLAGDVSKEEDVETLVKILYADFPRLNVIINNAGSAFLNNLLETDRTFEKAQTEMLTNYLSIIRLNEKLLPLLQKQEEAAIVNVSSIVAFAPNHILSTYGASKAALHSYTQSLRLYLAKTPVKVFELMPPLVNTGFSQVIGGANGISPAVVAEDLLKSFETETYEIHVGRTAEFYKLFHSSPTDALYAMNPTLQA